MQELIDRYLAGPAALREAIQGLSTEQLRARPVPGKWSTMEVVVHIADFEPILADRIRRIAALKKPLLLAADENLFIEHLAYHERDLEAELKLIEATRATTAAILKKLPPEALSRPGIHSEKGLVTLQDVLTAAGNHIYHHLPFIAVKRQALGLAS